MNRIERRMFEKIQKEDLDLSVPEIREMVARTLRARRKGGKATRRKSSRRIK